tara:strand:- start:3811 stop:4155 length:345 start_codon:yes stop_codon:yes gene_type:complete
MATKDAKAKPKAKTKPKNPKVSKESAAAIRAGVPKTSRAPVATGSAQGAHLKNMVRFREMDIDADLAKWIKAVTKRGKFADDSVTAVAMLRYMHKHARGKGLGRIVPHLKRLSK